MKIKQLASNMTELEIGPITVLFSYSTPVAGFNPTHGPNDTGHFKTTEKYSRTTTKHINKYFREEWGINPLSVKEVDQTYIDGLVK